MYPNFLGGMFVHKQVIHLMNTGCEVRVIVPVPYVPTILRGRNRWEVYENIPERDTIDMVSVYYPRYLRLPGKWFHSISCYSQYWGIKKLVRSLIDEFKPNILHTHAATAPGYLGLMIKKMYDLPLICCLRGCDINTYPFYDRFSMYLTKKLISGADQLLSVSNALKKTANTIEKPKREIRVVYNGCDSDTFVFRKEYRTQIRNELGISEKDKVLIFIGSLSKEKGILELMAAFTKVNSTKANLHLVIIGNGPEQLRIQNIVASHNIETKVHIIGCRPHDEIPKYLSSADIFALPSHTEGLPNVVLEAMACELPVIATRVGGIPEVVEEGRSGILIDKKNVDSLKDAIESLIKNESMAKEMGINGRKNVENNFSWYRNAKEVVQTYDEIINNKL